MLRNIAVDEREELRVKVLGHYRKKYVCRARVVFIISIIFIVYRSQASKTWRSKYGNGDRLMNGTKIPRGQEREALMESFNPT